MEWGEKTRFLPPSWSIFAGRKKSLGREAAKKKRTKPSTELQTLTPNCPRGKRGGSNVGGPRRVRSLKGPSFFHGKKKKPDESEREKTGGGGHRKEKS